MKWEKASPELGKILAEAVIYLDAEKKIMFGSPVYTVNHNMFAGVHSTNIFLRLSETDRKKIKSEYDEAIPFEPLPGRIMKEYINIPPSLYEDDTAFHTWLKRAHDFTASLKPKEPKVRK